MPRQYLCAVVWMNVARSLCRDGLTPSLAEEAARRGIVLSPAPEPRQRSRTDRD